MKFAMCRLHRENTASDVHESTSLHKNKMISRIRILSLSIFGLPWTSLTVQCGTSVLESRPKTLPCFSHNIYLLSGMAENRTAILNFRMTLNAIQSLDSKRVILQDNSLPVISEPIKNVFEGEQKFHKGWKWRMKWRRALLTYKGGTVNTIV